MIESAVSWLLDVLAIPQVGLTSVFFISLLSATLLPMGSEPALFAVVKSNQGVFWPAIAAATVGNTLGGAISYWLGFGAKKAVAAQAYAKERDSRWFAWMQRFGARLLLLSWLPAVGDLLCALAGWLRLPFRECVFYMAAGKFLRYVTLTWMLLHVPDGFWRALADWF